MWLGWLNGPLIKLPNFMSWECKFVYWFDCINLLRLSRVSDWTLLTRVPYWDTQFKSRLRNKKTITSIIISSLATVYIRGKYLCYFIDMSVLCFLLRCHEHKSSLSFRCRLNNLRRAKHENTPHWTMLKTGQKVFSKQIDHLQKWAHPAACSWEWFGSTYLPEHQG